MQAAEVLEPISQAAESELPNLDMTDSEEDRPSLTLIVGGKAFRDELAEIISQLYPRALGLSRNPDEARDLLSETAERALRFERHFMAGSNMRAWLNQILFSVFVTRCRRRRRERRALDTMQADPCAWFKSDCAPLMQTFSPRLQAAMQQLPEAFADTLLLVDVGELAYKDAAEELNVPVGTVMSRLHRARKLLREMLGEQAA